MTRRERIIHVEESAEGDGARRLVAPVVDLGIRQAGRGEHALHVPLAAVPGVVPVRGGEEAEILRAERHLGGEGEFAAAPERQVARRAGPAGREGLADRLQLRRAQVRAADRLVRRQDIGQGAEAVVDAEEVEPAAGVAEAGLAGRGRLHPGPDPDLEEVLPGHLARLDLHQAAGVIGGLAGEVALRGGDVLDEARGDEVERHRLAIGDRRRHHRAVERRVSVAFAEPAHEDELLVDDRDAGDARHRRRRVRVGRVRDLLAADRVRHGRSRLAVLEHGRGGSPLVRHRDRKLPQRDGLRGKRDVDRRHGARRNRYAGDGLAGVADQPGHDIVRSRRERWQRPATIDIAEGAGVEGCDRDLRQTQRPGRFLVHEAAGEAAEVPRLLRRDRRRVREEKQRGQRQPSLSHAEPRPLGAGLLS